MVLASGDLTDGKKASFADSNQFAFEWETYERLVRNRYGKRSGEDFTTWLDIRGNHGKSKEFFN